MAGAFLLAMPNLKNTAVAVWCRDATNRSFVSVIYP